MDMLLRDLRFALRGLWRTPGITAAAVLALAIGAATAICLVLAAIAALAGRLPARRATRVDPALALRAD